MAGTLAAVLGLMTFPIAPLRQWIHHSAFPWVALPILALAAVVAGYGLASLTGVTTFAALLSFKTLVAGCALLVGATFYWLYWDWVRARPWALLAAFAIFYPLFIYMAAQLSMMGLDIRARILMLALFCVPSIVMGARSLPAICRHYPHIAGWMAFVGVFLGYYFFFNLHTIDPRSPGVGGHIGEGALDFEKMYVIVTLAASVLLAPAALARVPNLCGFFAWFNRTLITLLIVYSAITILGYPLGAFTAMIDGFKRSNFIFTHPNHYAHYLGFMLTYLCGLWLYYRKQAAPPVSIALILTGVFLTLPAFLLAMSKTAMALTAVCLATLFLANQLGDSRNRLNPLFLVTPLLLCAIAALALQALGIVDFLGVITARFEDKESLLWRFATWQRVFSDVDASTTLFGHGLTAASARIVLLTVNNFDLAKGIIATPFVHNAYVETLYDFGLIGFGWLAGLLALMGAAAARFWRARPTSQNKPLLLLTIALTLYYLGVCNFDEMFYAIPFPFWYFSAIVWSMTLFEEAQPQSDERTLA